MRWGSISPWERLLDTHRIIIFEDRIGRTSRFPQALLFPLRVLLRSVEIDQWAHGRLWRGDPPLRARLSNNRINYRKPVREAVTWDGDARTCLIKTIRPPQVANYQQISEPLCCGYQRKAFSTECHIFPQTIPMTSLLGKPDKRRSVLLSRIPHYSLSTSYIFLSWSVSVKRSFYHECDLQRVDTVSKLYVGGFTLSFKGDIFYVSCFTFWPSTVSRN